MAVNRFRRNWDFMLRHMPAIREALSLLPSGYFLNFSTATPKQDKEQATDLVLEIEGGTMAVRIRRKKYYEWGLRRGLDWSIRVKSNGAKTEIDKLREGFGDWYFYGYSEDNKSGLAYWCLIDLHKTRQSGILENSWMPKDNNDGTAAIYIPIKGLLDCGALISSSHDVV